MFNIEIYEDKNGKSDVYEYIQRLNKSKSKENRQKLKKINMYIDLLSEYGLTTYRTIYKKIR